MIGRGRKTRTAHIGPETTTSIAWARSGRFPLNLVFGSVAPYEPPEVSLRQLSVKERHDAAQSWILDQAALARQDRLTGENLEDINSSVNVAIAGLGLVQPSETDVRHGPGHVERLTMTGLLKAYGVSPELLEKEGAVGDFSYCLFDEKGNESDAWKFFLTLGDNSKHARINFYRHLVAKMRPVLVMAGFNRWKALLPALDTKMFNVLVTDAFTAEKLMARQIEPRQHSN